MILAPSFAVLVVIEAHLSFELLLASLVVLAFINIISKIVVNKRDLYLNYPNKREL
jgi:hypothetical protein